jgi:DoxX-like family
MEIFLWVVTGLLAAVSLGAAANKLVTPREKILQVPQMQWARDYSQSSIKLIAVAELLGGLGIVLPWAFDIARVLTPLAAVGLALLQVGALVTHARRRERSMIALNSALIVCALIVAVGRFSSL